MGFVAVDVETANPDLSSICQIGVVCFQNGSVMGEWQRIVDPEDYFDSWNISIHGITEADVHGAPTLPQLFHELQPMLEGVVVACHTSFDHLALNRASAKYRLPDINCTWLDTAKVVRRAWPEYSRSGYGLANITASLDIRFEHHVAKEDARAAGEVLLRAIAQTGISVQDWLKRVQQPISQRASPKIAREGNPDGPLAGEVVVFTGALSMPRREAAELAARAGCTVTESVNKHTTILVVGDQDLQRLVGHRKSSKHRKAEEMMAKGQPIRILKESDLVSLVGLQ